MKERKLPIRLGEARFDGTLILTRYFRTRQQKGLEDYADGQIRPGRSSAMGAAPTEWNQSHV
jgi:hypothetical protein